MEVALGQASSNYFGLVGCQDSTFGIATDYVLDGRNSIPGDFFSIVSRLPLGPTLPPIQWVTGALSAGVKRPKRADHSPPRCVEVKNGGAIRPLPRVLMA
jgi:hypothetical protein